MEWIHPSEQLPAHGCPIIMNCTEGVGEGYYKGNLVFHFNRYGEDLSDDDVYGWMEMPRPSNKCSDCNVIKKIESMYWNYVHACDYCSFHMTKHDACEECKIDEIVEDLNDILNNSFNDKEN